MAVLWPHIPVKIFTFCMMYTTLMLNISWNPVLHIFPMDTNVICANPSKMCPLWAPTGIWGNARLRAMDECIWPPLSSPTVMVGGMFDVC